MRRIEYLSVIGNIAPMVGLLGTVTGMIFAFQQVATTRGAAGAGDLAEGIYQALVTTVGGLVVAIPALGCLRDLSQSSRCVDRRSRLPITACSDADQTTARLRGRVPHHGSGRDPQTTTVGGQQPPPNPDLAKDASCQLVSASLSRFA